MDAFAYREEPKPADAEAVGELVDASGFFRPDEVDVAMELVEERLARGLDSEYYFWFADAPNGALAGYACYGPIACTVGCYDLYWIAVDKAIQGRGLGRRLMEFSEESVRRLGGRRIYVETSGKAIYEPTREFYRRCKYEVAAVMTDFYDLGDDKVVFYKDL